MWRKQAPPVLLSWKCPFWGGGNWAAKGSWGPGGPSTSGLLVALGRWALPVAAGQMPTGITGAGEASLSPFETKAFGMSISMSSMFLGGGKPGTGPLPPARRPWCLEDLRLPHEVWSSLQAASPSTGRSLYSRKIMHRPIPEHEFGCKVAYLRVCVLYVVCMPTLQGKFRALHRAAVLGRRKGWEE